MRTPTGAAFVNFENPESATKSIMNMNKKTVEEKQIKVMKYQTKQELKARKMAFQRNPMMMGQMPGMPPMGGRGGPPMPMQMPMPMPMMPGHPMGAFPGSRPVPQPGRRPPFQQTPPQAAQGPQLPAGFENVRTLTKQER